MSSMAGMSEYLMLLLRPQQLTLALTSGLPAQQVEIIKLTPCAQTAAVLLPRSLPPGTARLPPAAGPLHEAVRCPGPAVSTVLV